MKKIPLLNTAVNDLALNETVELLMQWVRQGRPSYVVEVNVDVVVKMERDALLRRIAADADLTLVDGKPLMWIAGWYGRQLKQKVSGSDLVPALLQRAAAEKRSVFILGGKGDAAEKAAENLRRSCPELVIAGAFSPSMGFEQRPEELETIRAMLRKAKPDILLACFGCPKQEKWVYENYRTCGAGVTLCAGATVDFLAGTVRRAPRVLSEHGLEWLYRFAKEPQRLFRRYFVDDMQIIRLAWKYRRS